MVTIDELNSTAAVLSILTYLNSQWKMCPAHPAFMVMGMVSKAIRQSRAINLLIMVGLALYTMNQSRKRLTSRIRKLADMPRILVARFPSSSSGCVSIFPSGKKKRMLHLFLNIKQRPLKNKLNQIFVLSVILHFA